MRISPWVLLMLGNHVCQWRILLNYKSHKLIPEKRNGVTSTKSYNF